MSDTNTRIPALAARLGVDIKELRAALAALPSVQSVIDDLASSATGDKTYSAAKISSMIAASVAQARAETLDEIRAGAPEALDTLNELVTRINDDQDAFAVVQALASNTVRSNEPKALTEAQQAQARANIGLVDVDFEAAYIAARDAV